MRYAVPDNTLDDLIQQHRTNVLSIQPHCRHIPLEEFQESVGSIHINLGVGFDHNRYVAKSSRKSEDFVICDDPKTVISLRYYSGVFDTSTPHRFKLISDLPSVDLENKQFHRVWLVSGLKLRESKDLIYNTLSNYTRQFIWMG